MSQTFKYPSAVDSKILIPMMVHALRAWNAAYPLPDKTDALFSRVVSEVRSQLVLDYCSDYTSVCETARELEESCFQTALSLLAEGICVRTELDSRVKLHGPFNWARQKLDLLEASIKKGAK